MINSDLPFSVAILYDFVDRLVLCGNLDRPDSKMYTSVLQSPVSELFKLICVYNRIAVQNALNDG
jgi:hypothetical protein